MKEQGAAALELQHSLDREVDLVSSAIDLVASGVAVATTVAGLRMTELVVEIVRPRADARGVVIETLWGPDETSNDVRVRREEPAP